MNKFSLGALQKGNAATRGTGIHWRAKMAQVIRERGDAEKKRIEAELAPFRDLPDEDWDPDFAPVTAADLLRRRALAGR